MTAFAEGRIELPPGNGTVKRVEARRPAATVTFAQPDRPALILSVGMSPTIHRCRWAESDPLSTRYHDEEWGVPSHDDRHFFEMLTLEGAQAGLSWITILRKRDNYRKAFDGFDPAVIARYDQRRVGRLLQDEGIVRNRLKIGSTIDNARAFLDVQQEHGSFDAYVWTFVGGKPRVNRPTSLSQVPTTTEQSDALSKALKKRGFRFVGSTIMYSFMQACGLVDDHERTCFRARPAGRRSVSR